MTVVYGYSRMALGLDTSFYQSNHEKELYLRYSACEIMLFRN